MTFNAPGTETLCWDHVFARGLEAPPPRGRGVVADNNGASDHLLVWVDLPLPGPRCHNLFRPEC